MDKEYVDTLAWHKDYTSPEGRRFYPNDGETRESLAARGYVDHPAKAGFLNVDDHKREAYERINRQFRDGKIPSWNEFIVKDIESEQKKLQRLREEVQSAEAKRKALDESIRQKESPAQVTAMNEEKEMDDYQDTGAFSEEFLRGMETKRRETQGKKAKTVPVEKEVSQAAA